MPTCPRLRHGTKPLVHERISTRKSSLSMMKTPIRSPVLPGRYSQRGPSIHTGTTYKYMARRKDCKGCKLRTQCTRDNNGRSVQRHIRNAMLLITKKSQSSKGYQNPSAPYGTILCKEHTVWIRSGTVKGSMEDNHSGVSYLCHPEH